MPSVMEAWSSDKFNWSAASDLLIALINPNREEGTFPWETPDIKAIPVLIGEQGVGKTERMRQIARELGMEYRDSHIGARAFEDVLGIASRSEDPFNPGHHATLAPPGFPVDRPKQGKYVIFSDGSEEKYDGPEKHLTWVKVHKQQAQVVVYTGYGVYFHDEIMTADVDKQNQIRDMVDNRRVGMLMIADGWFQVGATNPPTRGFLTVKRTDQAVEDRYLYIPVQPSWVEAVAYWELNKLVPDALVHYILWRNGEGFFGGEKDESRLSPRRWVAVGNLIARMQVQGMSPDDIAKAMALNLSPSHGKEFKSFVKFGNDQTKFPIRTNDLLDHTKADVNMKIIKDWKEGTQTHALLYTTILALRAWGNAAKDKPDFSMDKHQVETLARLMDDLILPVDAMQDIIHVFGASSVGPALIGMMRCNEDVMRKLSHATAVENGQADILED